MGSGRVENQACCPYTAGSMRARLVPSRRLALAFVSLLGVILGVVLFSESARVPLRTPLVPRSARGEPTTIALEGREGRQGTTVFRLALAATDPHALAARGAVALPLEPRRRGPVSSPRELRVRGSDCAFAAAGRDAIGIDEPDRLPPLTRLRASGDAALRNRARPRRRGGGLRRSRAAGLRAPRGRGAGADPGAAARGETGAARRARRLRPLPGDGPTDRPSQPHVARLSRDRLARGAGVRRHRPGPRGLPRVPDASAPGRVVLSRRGRGRARGGAAALLAASLAALYAVLAPPLSGPDEPYHLLGYADLTKDSALAEDAVAWMAETHLWRIRYNPEEHFRTIDVGQPFVVEDSQLRPTEVAQRSAVLARLERAVAPLLRGLPAPRVLLALRLLNALVFALAVGVATALAVALVPEPLPQWLAFPFLFVPSLPFFAMHVSETALLCSIYVLLAISLAVLFGDGPRLSLGRPAPRPGHRPDAGGRAFAVAAHRSGGGRPPGPGRARAVRGAQRPTGRRSSSGGASASARPSSSSCWTTPTAR